MRYLVNVKLLVTVAAKFLLLVNLKDAQTPSLEYLLICNHTNGIKVESSYPTLLQKSPKLDGEIRRESIIISLLSKKILETLTFSKKQYRCSFFSKVLGWLQPITILNCLNNKLCR